MRVGQMVSQVPHASGVPAPGPTRSASMRRNRKYIMAVSAWAVSACLLACTSGITQPRAPRQTQCPDMNTCLMTASEYCADRQFTMAVQEGSRSGPTVAEWRPSRDGQFHLRISCE
jgi:hypothetical protein